MLIPLLLVFTIYMLAADENHASVACNTQRETSTHTIQIASTGVEARDALHTMMTTVERQRRLNWRSAVIGALLLFLLREIDTDAVTFCLWSIVIVACLQNFRAYHMEEELTSVLKVYLQHASQYKQ
jgi:hypothetical protein